MEKKEIKDLYKNSGKEIHVYYGDFRNNVLITSKDTMIIVCETDKEYCVLTDKDKQSFLQIAKDMEHEYRCLHVIGRASAWRYEDSVKCDICMLEDDEEKATELMKKAIKSFVSNNNINCDGI